jgi:acyl carrier protein
MDDQEVRGAVREFVDELGSARGLRGVADDASLTEIEIVDSLGIFQLVAFLEDRFHITIGDADITPDNFETIGAITDFVIQRA